MSRRLSHAATLVALALVTVLMLTACQKEAEAPAVTSTGPVVDSVLSEDSIMIYYDVRGAGDQALVFVHCWSCDRTYWKNQVDEFARDYRLVTVDLAGHGQSGLGRENWTMAAFGADVAAVVNKLDLNNVILVGHSMGGPVIIEAARRLPGRVVALVGVDNFQSFGQSFSPEEVVAWVSQFSPDFVGATDRFVRAMFPEGTDTGLVNHVAADMASSPPEMAIEAISETVGYDYRSALAEVRLPIRTISSDKYPTDVEGNRAIAASFDMKLMPGFGHFLHLEAPVEFNRLLRETLGEFRPSEPTQ